MDSDPLEPPAPHPAFTPCPFPRWHPSQLHRDDAHFMQLALNLAIDAWNADEVPIGAVVVLGGVVIARAHNSVNRVRDPTAHAEILALTQAASAIGDWRLNATTLYVTKEPCPMCAGACIMARVGKVVFGLPDPKMGCLGGASALHQLPHLNHRVEVLGGCLADESRTLLQAYFGLKRDPPAGGSQPGR